MKKYFTLPNVLTMVRIAGAICLIFVTPLSRKFFIIYTISGISDVLDGFAARKLKMESEIGAKLDSIADLSFYGVLLIRIFPVLWEMLPNGIWYAVGAVLVIRLCSYFVALKKYHRFASLHTYMNKLTGLMLFCVPYLLDFTIALGYCVAVTLVGGIASAEELVIHLKSKEYNGGQKRIGDKIV